MYDACRYFRAWGCINACAIALLTFNDVKSVLILKSRGYETFINVPG